LFQKQSMGFLERLPPGEDLLNGMILNKILKPYE